MHLNALILTIAAPAFVTAQDLPTVLSGQASLSSLVTLLGQVQNTTNFLASQENVTLFAPNNAALETLIVNNGSFTLGEAVVEDPGVIEQLLRYHLYRGVVRAADISEIPQFVTSYLDISGIVPDGDVSGSNVTGGQVASVGLDEEGNAVVTTGVKTTSQVVSADLEFDNGIIHIVNDLLTIPLSLPETLVLGNFTALAGAAIQTDLVPALESLPDITVFCPNNDAFQRLAASGANTTITNDQLASILRYHIAPGTIGYSTSLTNNSALPTMNGEELSITISSDGAVFANSARVINADILIENGVLHVIDEVLNPATSDSEPEDNSADNTVSLPTNVPFTSEVPPETSTIFRQLTQTTSLVAAALVTGMPNRTASTSVGSSNTTSARVVEQTTNASVRKEIPVLAAITISAVAFALHYY